jgi:glycosyltransferase involved in cell wall biosynthesis
MKGQDRLIDALPFIREVYPSVLCVFAGQLGYLNGFEDPYQFLGSLQKSIRHQNLEQNVAFVGEVDCLPSLLRQADLYVHTSRTESFCRAVAEALACGTPAVVFEVGALPEVAGPGAVYVRSGDTLGLAKAVIDLISRKDKRSGLAEAGLRHIEKLFNAREVSAKFSEALRIACLQ